MTLEGHFDYPPHMLPAEAFRDWRLCRIVGPPTTWLDLPAERLDWILAVDAEVQKAKANVQEEASRRG